MKVRLGFVSNSSSASFVVGLPTTDKSAVLQMLYYQLEHVYFGKYYLREAVKDRLSFSEKKLNEAKLEFSKLSQIPVEQRLAGRDKNYDKLDWAKSTLRQWQSSFDDNSNTLEELEGIEEGSEEELVKFGLRFYGISLGPTYKKTVKERQDTKPIKVIQMGTWDPDATDDRDIVYDEPSEQETQEEIVGYELRDFVTMFNDYGDMPHVLRNITGVLAFVYKSELKCWVDEDDD